MMGNVENVDEIEPAEGRTAKEYFDAVNAVIDIAEMAVAFIPGGGPAAAAARKAIKYAPVARQVAQKLPDVAPMAKAIGDSIQEKAPGIFAPGVEKVSGAIKGAADAVGERGRAAGGAIKNAVDAREQERARRAARRALLDGAGVRLTAPQFLENWADQRKLGAGFDEGYFAFSGCYALATYDSEVKKGDFSAFRDIYIGGSTNVGASIYADVSGSGNVDVYADVKYKQHVYVLLYPCPAEKIDELRASLITALDADGSYNRQRS